MSAPGKGPETGNEDRVELLAPPVLDRLADALATQGFAVERDWLAGDLVTALEAEALAITASLSSDAKLGRAAAKTAGGHIRRSRIRWLDGGTPAQARFLALTETLRTALNERLFLGLFEFEAQFALYEPGGFYARHLDSLAGQRNRIVSLVTYFNRDWPADGGGELAIWRGEEVTLVRPEAGTLVLMLSEEIPHEARPSSRRRTSIAGWYRVNGSGGGRVDPAR